MMRRHCGNCPGWGAYTAAALMAFAFGKRALVMDANIERILARFGGIETPLPAAKSELRAVLDALTPAVRAGDFAQGLMDIGNAICTPPAPEKRGSFATSMRALSVGGLVRGTAWRPGFTAPQSPKIAAPYS